jgi:serine/threonine-protein kinase RsbW
LAEVRRLVRDATSHEHVDHDLSELAVLVATEASTNVIRHTHSSVIDLSVACDGDQIMLRIGDEDRTPIPAPSPDPSGVSGHGLVIIDRLATRWGVATTPEGKELWVETPARDARQPPSD